MTRCGGLHPGHGGGPDWLGCCGHVVAWRALCRAARGRWGAEATFAQQNGESSAPGTRQSQGVNGPGPVRNELFPVFPVKCRLFPVRAGTVFFNGDNGLRQFLAIVPGVPYKSCRDPEARAPPKPCERCPATRCPGAGGHGPAGDRGRAPPRHGSFLTPSCTGAKGARERASEWIWK